MEWRALLRVAPEMGLFVNTKQLCLRSLFNSGFYRIVRKVLIQTEIQRMANLIESDMAQATEIHTINSTDVSDHLGHYDHLVDLFKMLHDYQ